MKYGTSFPQDRLLADPLQTRDFAQAVDDLGYDFLTGSDHVLTNEPSGINREPLVLLAYLAACTKRLELGTSIVILPQRQTALVAKQMAEIDLLSGGRLHLGVGLGNNAYEFQGLNEDFHSRGRRVEEQIAVLRALWTQETVTFKGKWHRLDAVGVSPLPRQRPIPIWMGGAAEPAVKPIARLADGWVPPFGGAATIAPCSSSSPSSLAMPAATLPASASKAGSTSSAATRRPGSRRVTSGEMPAPATSRSPSISPASPRSTSTSPCSRPSSRP